MGEHSRHTEPMFDDYGDDLDFGGDRWFERYARPLGAYFLTTVIAASMVLVSWLIGLVT